MIEVRPATRSDLEWIVESLKAFTDEMGDPYYAFAGRDYARSFVGEMIEKHLVFVSTDGETRTGFISGIATPHPFNTTLNVTTSFFWYVLPERRGARSAYQLLEAFGNAGHVKGGPTIVGVREGANITEHGMARLGFKLHERVYRRMA